MIAVSLKLMRNGVPKNEAPGPIAIPKRNQQCSFIYEQCGISLFFTKSHQKKKKMLFQY